MKQLILAWKVVPLPVSIYLPVSRETKLTCTAVGGLDGNRMGLDGYDPGSDGELCRPACAAGDLGLLRVT